MKIIKHITVVLVWCFVIESIRAQSLYEVVPLSVNTPYSNEVAAITYGDGIVFCSDRSIHVLISKMDSDNKPLFHLYFAPKKDNTRWGQLQLLNNIATDGHQCPCTFNATGNEIYYTLSDNNGVGIFSARKDNTGWSNIRPFIHNRRNYSNAHPSLSRDGKYLFFASDMPDGYGGFDIYRCEWTPRGWGTPQNLGPEVNGPEDELYPTIDTNGTLYFSSYGHRSKGGLDIFSVREINGNWVMRQQMESPVNSEENDFAYTPVNNDVGDAYFSSNREGSIDIYSAKSLFPYFPVSAEQEENEYSYEFFEHGTENLDTTSFRYEWSMGDGTVLRGQTVDHTFRSIGQYFIELNVVDTLTGEREKQVASYLFDVLDIEQPYITSEDTVEVGKPMAFDAAKTFLPELNIEGYYWIFGDGIRVTGEHASHIYTIPGTYKVQLGVVGKSKEDGEKEEKVCSYKKIVVTESN